MLHNPIHEGMLVSFTDGPADHYEEFENDDGIFHVEVGFGPDLSFKPTEDDKLASMIADRVALTIEDCPFTTIDRQQFRDVLHRWRQSESL